MKRKILFVDDERSILQGLQRMLHRMRGSWDMRFAGSGREALALMAQESVDVIVSDMRMPEMDGAELLTRVKSEYPQMVRIVLSGHTDHKSIMKTVRLAHQYISKPCDADRLRVTIDRACKLKELLADQALRSLVSRLETLPGLPTTYSQIMDALKDPECSIQQVGEIISRDIGMTAKILQLVNSAFYGIARHVSGPVEAAVYLGLNNIQALVMTIGLFSDFENCGISDHVVQEVYNHSMKTGSLAREIALSADLGREKADDAFMAGLLHDLGKLVIAYNMPKTYGKLLNQSLKRRIDIQEAEEKMLGATHGQIGGYLIGLWGLPHSIMEAVAFHHVPRQCPSVGFDALGAVHVANALAHHVPDGTAAANSLTGVDQDYLAEMGISACLDRWQGLAARAA
jgi:HD-like signal output (HDOD) protein